MLQYATIKPIGDYKFQRECEPQNDIIPVKKKSMHILQTSTVHCVGV